MKIAVINYPGSHGVDAVIHAYSNILGQEAYAVWHEAESLSGADVVVIPGGASFGDYLRPGALAKSSPVSGGVRKFAKDGGAILGIGNGFQILCEIGLLPGALLRNSSDMFVARDVQLVVESVKCPFTKGLKQFGVLKLPVACYFGSYYADKRELRDLEKSGHIALRFGNKDGDVEPEDNATGSLSSIAGIISRHENVMGIIAHPERAVRESMGGVDGLEILKSVLS